MLRHRLPNRLLAVASVGAFVAGTSPVSADVEPIGHAEGSVEEASETIVVIAPNVHAAPAAAPVVTDVIDRDRIQESGARTVAAALALQPGLWLDRGLAGTGISMQGLGPKYVLVLIDGRRQLGRVDGAIDLDRFSTSDVAQIEIVRGPSSALFGSDALGGVINVISRPPDQARAELTAQVDHRGATELSASLAGTRRYFSAAANGEWRRGGAVDLTPESPGTTIAAYGDGRGDLRGEYRRDRWRVAATTGYQRRDLEGIDTNASGAVLDRRNLIEVADAALRGRWTTERTAVDARLGSGYYRDQYALDQRGAAALDQYQDTREHLLEASAQVDRAIGGRHRASLGAEVLQEGLTSDRLREPGDRLRAGMWLQDVWRAGRNYDVMLVPAIRLDADTQFGTHVTPHLAIRWDPRDDLLVRSSLGAGYRAPSFKELLLRFENPGVGYVVEGNPDLRPETSTSIQAASEWRARSWLAVSAQIFGNQLRDLITTTTIGDGMDGGPIRFGYDNIGHARTFGAELGLAIDLGRLTLGGGWAYTRARDTDADQPLEGIPAHRVAATARWRDDGEGLTAFAELAATGARPYLIGDTRIETAPRCDIRARVARRFGERLELFLGVDNLLGAGDAAFDPMAPRTLYAGATARR